MNEQLETALTSIITKATTAGDFIISEAPEVITQLLTINMICNLLVICVFTIVFIVSSIISVKFYKKAVKLNGYDSESWYIGSIIAAIVVFVCMLIMTVYTYDTFKIEYAPKVWLIEYAADLVRPSS